MGVVQWIVAVSGLILVLIGAAFLLVGLGVEMRKVGILGVAAPTNENPVAQILKAICDLIKGIDEIVGKRGVIGIGLVLVVFGVVLLLGALVF